MSLEPAVIVGAQGVFHNKVRVLPPLCAECFSASGSKSPTVVPAHNERHMVGRLSTLVTRRIIRWGGLCLVFVQGASRAFLLLHTNLRRARFTLVQRCLAWELWSWALLRIPRLKRRASRSVSVRMTRSSSTHALECRLLRSQRPGSAGRAFAWWAPCPQSQTSGIS